MQIVGLALIDGVLGVFIHDDGSFQKGTADWAFHVKQADPTMLRAIWQKAGGGF